MTDYVVTAPDGKQYKIGAPEGTTQEQALEHFKSEWAAGRVPKATDSQPDTSNLGSLSSAIDPGPFIKGIGQGIIGIPEAIYQYARHLPAPLTPPPASELPVVGPLAEPLRKYQRDVESTKTGVGGEVVGNILGFMGGGEIADLLRIPGLLTKLGTSPAARTELSTFLQSQTAEPSQGDSFWTDKGASAILSHLFGRWLGRPTQQAARNIATTTNAQRAAQDAADALATKQANEANLAAVRQANAADVQSTRQANAADATAHSNLTALDKEQHQALADAQERFHQQQRATAQAAADAIGGQTDLALRARQAQIDAKAAVPGSTTQGWWDRTLQQIGVTDPALTRATPATGAKVRDVVGGRLNSIMEDMHLDPNDPAFTQHINEIRDEVLQKLPKDEKAGWFNKPPEPELNPLLVHPTTGQPLERTTRGVREKAPEEPSGTFYSTVMAPLAKGPMTGRELTNYVSRIGAKAEELAIAAGRDPGPRRTVLQAQADALRNIEDAVIGHAAGTPEQKTALESARRAYFMWAIGNDAARASRNGVATPAQLINSMTRRLRGEARYEQALNNPDSPYHDMTNWLQSQLTEHTRPTPSAAQVRAAQPTPPKIPPAHPTPIPPPSPRQAPTPRPMPTPRPLPTPQQPPAPRAREPVPDAPQRPRGVLAPAVTSAAAWALGHPWVATAEALHAAKNLFGGSGGKEKLVERGVRALLENFPRTAGRVATPIAGTAAGQIPRQVPQKEREGAGRVGQAAADALGKVSKDMYYRWTTP